MSSFIRKLQLVAVYHFFIGFSSLCKILTDELIVLNAIILEIKSLIKIILFDSRRKAQNLFSFAGVLRKLKSP